MGITTPFEHAFEKIRRFEKSTQFAVRSGVLTITFHKKDVERYFGSIDSEIRHGWFTLSEIKEFLQEGVLREDETIYIVMKSEKVPELSLSTSPVALSPVLRANKEQNLI